MPEFQDLSLFRAPAGYAERPLWFVQFWWLFDSALVRWTPQAMYGWRRLALRIFGAKVGRNVLIRPGVKVTFPWKVTIGDHCWIGDNVTIYSIAEVVLGEHTVVSQESYLCTGTHDYTKFDFPLVASAINIGAECWVAARAFIGPGVRIGNASVVGAGSVVLRDVPERTVVGGNPAKALGARGARP